MCISMAQRFLNWIIAICLLAQVASGFDVTNWGIVGSDYALQWEAKTGGRYDVWGTDSLGASWSNRGRRVATPSLNYWIDTQSDSKDMGFYDVRVGQVHLTNVETWAYNIQYVNTTTQHDELVGTHFDMYVLEPVVTEDEEENFDIAGLITEIRDYNVTNHHKNPVILAYVDMGQAEDWRWYWKAGWGPGNPEWIVAGDPDGWEGNYPVAYWYTGWQDIVIYGTDGMSHVQATLDAGFDGIYMDWVEAFSDTAVVAKAETDGITNTVTAMLDFIENIRTYARVTATNANPNYWVVAQNAPDLYQEDTNRYEELIDAIALEAIWYDGEDGFDEWEDHNGFNTPTDDIYPGWTDEVIGYLEPMQGRFPIFCAEYAQDVNGTNLASYVYTNLCATNAFIPYCTRRSLQRLSKTPYPPTYTPQDY